MDAYGLCWRQATQGTLALLHKHRELREPQAHRKTPECSRRTHNPCFSPVGTCFRRSQTLATKLDIHKGAGFAKSSGHLPVSVGFVKGALQPVRTCEWTHFLRVLRAFVVPCNLCVRASGHMAGHCTYISRRLVAICAYVRVHTLQALFDCQRASLLQSVPTCEWTHIEGPFIEPCRRVAICAYVRVDTLAR